MVDQLCMIPVCFCPSSAEDSLNPTHLDKSTCKPFSHGDVLDDRAKVDQNTTSEKHGQRQIPEGSFSSQGRHKDGGRLGK